MIEIGNYERKKQKQTNRNPGTKRKSLRKNKLKWTKTKQKDKN